MVNFPVTTLSRGDRMFPAALAATAGLPDTLYVRGNLDALRTEHRLAVVGTRKMTSYGEQAVGRLVRPVAAQGVCIVSGLALGIDATAHRACLDAGGVTVAVLGSGINDDTIGPRANLGLAHDILSNGGALVSEYAAGTPADRWTFPARNRIISALSAAVLVIEADIKSGALITARLAADQGRDVMAVPGSLFWARSAGPNMLIQNGAQAIVSPSNILEAFGIDDEPPTQSVSTHDPVQIRIAAILKHGPTTADTLAATLVLSAADTLAELSLMEVRGLIKRNSDGTYRTA